MMEAELIQRGTADATVSIQYRQSQPIIIVLQCDCRERIGQKVNYMSHIQRFAEITKIQVTTEVKEKFKKFCSHLPYI